MNAVKRKMQKELVESWQCVRIPWDHFSAFARKALASMAKKVTVMASVTVVNH